MSANIRTNLNQLEGFSPVNPSYVSPQSMNFSALPMSALRSESTAEEFLVQEEFGRYSLSGAQAFTKRVMDIGFALLALSVFGIPMLIIAIIIKLESKGPVFYGQERIGLDGKKFKMWKFRSMRVDAEKEIGAVWAIRNDPRRTKFGCFLRASSLDELPQLWNVLKGEMAMVGPRPERSVFVEEFKRTLVNYAERHQHKVGITGWAQVHGWRGNTSLQRRLDYDLHYVKNWSPWLDIKILFLTLFRGFINDNAY